MEDLSQLKNTNRSGFHPFITLSFSSFEYMETSTIEILFLVLILLLELQISSKQFTGLAWQDGLYQKSFQAVGLKNNLPMKTKAQQSLCYWRSNSSLKMSKLKCTYRNLNLKCIYILARKSNSLLVQRPFQALNSTILSFSFFFPTSYHRLKFN